MAQVWRFQADVKPGENDPLVTVFVSEIYTNGAGDIVLPQDTSNPATVKLSELPAFLANPVKPEKAVMSSPATER